MTTSTKSRPPAGLDPASIEYARHLRAGQRQMWGALSADHVWQYIRVEDVGTPWAIVHRPTGATSTAGSIHDATTWTARYGLEQIERDARRVIAAGGTSDGMALRMVAGRPMARILESPEVIARRLGEARRILQVLAGELAAGHPDGVCSCGGLLVADVHADVCRECDGDPGLPRRCRLLHRHAACGPADPVQCDHLQCRRRAWPRPALPALPGCARGWDWCCGCCGWGDESELFN
jgi:hypothetical protein